MTKETSQAEEIDGLLGESDRNAISVFESKTPRTTWNFKACVVCVAILSCSVIVSTLIPQWIRNNGMVVKSRDDTRRERINVVVILPDQLRYDMQGLRQEEQGIPKKSQVRTPNIDRLSVEGVSFHSAYTHAAVCVPARTSLLTGCTIEHTGVRSNAERTMKKIQKRSDAKEKLKTLRTFDTILAQDHGYSTEYHGKWHSPEDLGIVYNNDVRMSGESESWFHKYDKHGHKHLALGMGVDYKKWLENNHFSTNAVLEKGEQYEKIGHFPYVPDTFDPRYGKPPNTTPRGIASIEMQGRARLPTNLSLTQKQAGDALDALDRLHKAGKPFSLFVSFQSPHPPMIPTDKYYYMYDPSDMVVPPNIDDNLLSSPYLTRREKYEFKGITNHSNAQRLRATYNGLVTEVDEQVGKLLNSLDQLGITNNTLVVFASDHGEMLGSHGMVSKSVFFEESAHVPLILRLPGKIPAGVAVDTPVSLIDVYGTILDYAQVGREYKSDGTSLRRYIERKDTSEQDSYVVTEWNSCQGKPEKGSCIRKEPGFLVRKGNWKLMMQRISYDGLDVLFNLKEDPFEMNNLLYSTVVSVEAVGKAEQLKALLVKYLVKMKHPAARPVAERRSWRLVDCWVSDVSLEFRPSLHDSTRTEWLHVGTSSTETLQVSDIYVMGTDSSCFSTSCQRDHASSDDTYTVWVVAVTYSNPDCSGNEIASATLVLPHGTNESSKTSAVKLLGPKRE